MRVFALSDIHVDYPDNRVWIERLSRAEYCDDVLILAGDVSHIIGRLERTLARLKTCFAQVFFVPGNHELWIHKGEAGDSVHKFMRIQALCARLGVNTEPRYLPGQTPVWIVPLLSWYTKPEQGSDSLFVAKSGEDPSLSAWVDNYLIQWPPMERGKTASDYFLQLNANALSKTYPAPIISFSHFLPRSDLIYTLDRERDGQRPVDAHPSFNFSRVAGSRNLETQIRQLGSAIHVYGHQHRNRYRLCEGVLYVSHCLGYPAERKSGSIRYLETEPRLIWDTEATPGNRDTAE